MFNVRVSGFDTFLYFLNNHSTYKLSTRCLILINPKQYAGLFLVSLNLMVLMLHHLSMIGREKLLIPKFIFYAANFAKYSCIVFLCFDLQEVMK